MEHIGILGGTFNPVHNGHINMAEGFLERLPLDYMLVMPVWSPPHKQADMLLPAEKRLKMCSLAVADDKRYRVCDMEIRRGGKSYTSDTLKELSKIHPNAQLYFLMGADMFMTLESWHEFETITRLSILCAAARHEGETKRLREFAKVLNKRYGARCIVEKIPVIDVSSTQIREDISAGKDISALVPPKVYDYIKENHLYGI